MCGISCRVISQRTHIYLRGIVGIDRWVDLAIELKKYADTRPTDCDDDDQNAVYLMLMGYVLEDLAKGIIACRAYDETITDVIPFEERIKSLKFQLDDGSIRSLTIHELDKLYKAKNMGFNISDSEEKHLQAISQYTLWKGRYPVPTNINGVPDSWPSFDDMNSTAKTIYDKAMAEIQKLRTSHQ